MKFQHECIKYLQQVYNSFSEKSLLFLEKFQISLLLFLNVFGLIFKFL